MQPISGNTKHGASAGRSGHHLHIPFVHTRQDFEAPDDQFRVSPLPTSEMPSENSQIKIMRDGPRKIKSKHHRPALGPHISALAVGDRVWFVEEKLPYTVQARSRRYLICTKPFNLQRTVLYCIVDFKEDVRGPENLIFGFGAETREQCEEMLKRLQRDTGVGFLTEVSHRHRIPLAVRRTEKAK